VVDGAVGKDRCRHRPPSKSASRARSLRFYREFVADAPDELGSVVRLGTVPPLPGIPENLYWRPAIAVACCYAGAVENGERAVRALRRFGTPLVDLLAPSPYAAFQGGLDDTVLHGWHYYWKATNLTGLSDNAIAVIADHAYSASSPRSYSAMFHSGGAVARVPHDATAYAGRDVAHNISIDAVWLPDDPASTPRPRPLGRGGSSKPSNRTAPGASTSTSSMPTMTPAAFERPMAMTSTGDSPRSRPSTTPTTPSTTTRTSAPVEEPGEDRPSMIRMGGLPAMWRLLNSSHRPGPASTPDRPAAPLRAQGFDLTPN
jgi:hypothetical protein